MPDQHDLNWKEVATLYSDLRSALETMELPMPAEIDDYKAAASLDRESETTLTAKFELGFAYFPGGRLDREQVKDFNEQVRTGGRFDLAEVRSSYDVVDEAISSRLMSIEFLKAWAHLHVLLGRQHELQENQDKARDHFERAVNAGRLQHVGLRRVWYAAWVLAHSAVGNAGQRKDAEFKLAELCCDIWRGKKSAPMGLPAE